MAGARAAAHAPFHPPATGVGTGSFGETRLNSEYITFANSDSLSQEKAKVILSLFNAESTADLLRTAGRMNPLWPQGHVK